MESVLFILIGIVLGGIIGWLLAKSKFSGNNTEAGNYIPKDVYEQTKAELVQQNEVLQNRNKELGVLEANIKNLTEQLHNERSRIEELNKEFKKEFENLANEILEKKSKTFTEQNKTNLDNILNPLKEKIKNFEEKVEKTYQNESNERVSLKTEIKGLMELNKRLSEDANNLASALKGESKTQGDWGEIQLEMLLEKAGLTNGIHFQTQASHTMDDGSRLRPDLIINLPENKNLIIDSKVSLKAYEAYFNAETDEDKSIQLKAHIQSIRNHIRDLGGKNYSNIYEINSPDYVLMFIPVEPAFNIAVRNDDKIFADALDKNIVIVTTSTLLATMKTVSFIWKQEDQKKHVLEIADKAGKLYDKFVGFTDDLLTVGKNLNSAKKSYDDSMNKLVEGTGNLVKRAEDMKKLGAKATKSIDPNLINRAIEE